MQSIEIMQILKSLHLSDERVQVHSLRHSNISRAKVSEPPRSYTGDGAAHSEIIVHGNTVAPFAGASEVHVCMQLHLASGYGTRLWGFLQGLLGTVSLAG